jgi:hypothetical protein
MGYRGLRPEHGTGHTPSKTAQITHAWRFAFTLLFVFVAWCLATGTFTLAMCFKTLVT